MKYRLKPYLWLAALLSVLFTACNKEEDIYGIFYLDMVTAHTPENQTPYFTHQANDASAVDTLYPQPALSPEALQEGRRLLLQYRPIEQLSTNRQHIEIQALSAVHFDTLRIVPTATLDSLPNDTVYLQSVWKTGDFLNLRYRIEYNSSPHTPHPVSDENELSGDTLKLQLRHGRREDPVGHWRSLYSSFNIAAYRNRPYTTIQLYINQVNYNNKYYYFKLN